MFSRQKKVDQPLLNAPQEALSPVEREKQRDIDAANAAKPIVPAGTLYDIRINFDNGAVSGWKGPNFSQNEYFGEIYLTIQSSARELVLESDVKHRDQINLVRSQIPMALVVTSIAAFIIGMIFFNFISIIVASVIGVIYIIYFCIRCFWINRKIIPLWDSNLINNLIVFVQSDLPSLYNIRDPTLVFELIKLNKHYRAKNFSNSGKWYFIRISSNVGDNNNNNNNKDDESETKRINKEYEILITSSVNSEAFKIAANTEGAVVVNGKKNRNNNNMGFLEGQKENIDDYNDNDNENENDNNNDDNIAFADDYGQQLHQQQHAHQLQQFEDEAPPAYEIKIIVPESDAQDETDEHEGQ